MSAFICNPDHFRALGIFAATRTRYGPRVDPRYLEHVGPELAELAGLEPEELATAYARILWLENKRSVEAKYGDDHNSSREDPGVIDALDLCNYRVDPIGICKMVHCWEYQSCETGDLETTFAYKIAQYIKEAAIRAHPDYEDAPWDYIRPKDETNMISLSAMSRSRRKA